MAVIQDYKQLGLGFLTAPQIMNDTIAEDYGMFVTGLPTGTATQRTAAYTIAEQQAMRFFGTYLEPTTITGTSPWPMGTTRVQLPVRRLRSVGSVVAIHEAGCDCETDSYEISGCAWVRDYDLGVIDLRSCGSTIGGGAATCNCAGAQGYGRYGRRPYLLRVAATFGFDSGLLASDYTVLLALTVLSRMHFRQIVDPSGAEGGPGDPGLSSVSEKGYSESRMGLKDTIFGSTPEANMVYRLLKGSPYRPQRVLAFHPR